MRRAVIAIVLIACGCGLSAVGEATSATNTIPDASTDAGSGSETRGGAVHAGSALEFHASSSQFVNFDHITLPPDFTVEAWVKPATRGKEMMIVAEDRETNQNDQFRLGLLDTGVLYFIMSDRNSAAHGLDGTGGQPALQAPASTVPLGAWSHVAVTKSGASFVLLVDGVSVATFTADSAAFERDLDYDFRIGARMGIGGPTNYFDGIIDDVRLYSRARTAAEIAGDRSTGVGAGGGLAFYWPFDEGSGALVGDVIAKHDGMIENGPRWVPSDAF